MRRAEDLPASKRQDTEVQRMEKEAQIIAQVVGERINDLDHGFLGGLEAFSQAMRKNGQEDLAGEHTQAGLAWTPTHCASMQVSFVQLCV